VPGNEPARLAAVTVSGRVGGGGPLYRLWAGFRDVHQGSTDFNPVWECENGTLGADAAIAGDPTASPDPAAGAKVRVTFATVSTLANRLGITVAQGAVHGSHNYHHNAGRYLVLCRCKVTAGAVAGLQLRAGYANNTSSAPCEEVYVTNSDWRLIPLGEVTIPPLGYRSAVADVDYVGQAQLQFYAELVTGTPGVDRLELDALCLVPSEHLAVCEGAEVQNVALDPRPASWHVLEDDTTLAVAMRNGVPALNIEHAETDLYLPLGRGPIVVAVERATQHLLTEVIDFSISYHPRWLSYRE
jgi:hypothetical protein